MSAGNQVLRTTDEDIKRLNQLVSSSLVRNLNVIKSQAERRIVIFERRLVDLYNNELLVKARIYNNADTITIAEKYSAGLNTKVKPIQSFQGTESEPDPHRSYVYNKFNIYSTQYGINILSSELNRIDNEIQTLMKWVEKYNKIKYDIDEKLKEAKEKKGKNLFDKTIGRVLPPTPEDLAKDKIARARISNIFLIQRIASQYRNLTVDETSGAPVAKYPDEVKLPRELKMLRQLFWAHGQSDFVVYLSLESKEAHLNEVLNFDNPGDSKNILILNEVLIAERVTGRNTKTNIQVDRFIRDVLSTANDPTISEGIEKKSDTSLAEDDSVRHQTKSYPVSMKRLGEFYEGSFELPSITQSLRKWWKSRNEKLMKGLPVCPNVDHSQFKTDTDDKIAANDAINSATREKGEAAYRATLKTAQGFINKENKSRLGTLPKEAPDWAQIYTSIYTDSYRGSFRYKGSQVTVVRGTSLDPEVAQKKALKLIPPRVVYQEEYAYSFLLPVTGSEIKKFVAFYLWNMT